jgi:hypothetical protein
MIKQRQRGHRGPHVGALGYGAMVLEGYYGLSIDDEAITTLRCPGLRPGVVAATVATIEAFSTL